MIDLNDLRVFEIKVEVAAATGESEGRKQESLELLFKMAASFEVDHP